MLQVDVNKIIPLTEARDSLNKIVDEVDNTDEMYVFTKNGTPTAVIVGVNHLEKLTHEKLPNPKAEEAPSGFQSPPVAAANTAVDNQADDTGTATPPPAASPKPAASTTPPTSADDTEADTVQAASPADDLFNDFSDTVQPPAQPAAPSTGKSIFDDDEVPATPAPAPAEPPAAPEPPAPNPAPLEPAPISEPPTTTPTTNNEPLTPPATEATDNHTATQPMSYDDFIAQPPQNETPPPATENLNTPAEIPGAAVEPPAPTSGPVQGTVAPAAPQPANHPNYTYGSSNQGTAASQQQPPQSSM